jgi:hypothetical protein
MMMHSGRAMIGVWRPGNIVHMRLACLMNDLNMLPHGQVYSRHFINRMIE